jgi:hypothetical protein
MAAHPRTLLMMALFGNNFLALSTQQYFSELTNLRCNKIFNFEREKCSRLCHKPRICISRFQNEQKFIKITLKRNFFFWLECRATFLKGLCIANDKEQWSNNINYKIIVATNFLECHY